MKNKNQHVEDSLFKYYSLMIDRLRHFNKMQIKCRLYAIIGILITFIGIGYAVTPIESPVPAHNLLVVMFICIASCSGIFLIWYMDLIIFERRIATTLFQMLEYENKSEWLPKIIKSLVIFHKPWNYVHLKTFFYIGIFGSVKLTV